MFLFDFYFVLVTWYSKWCNTVFGSASATTLQKQSTHGEMQYVKKTHVLGVWKRDKKRAKMFLQGSGMANVPNSETTMRFFSEFSTNESLLRKRLL